MCVGASTRAQRAGRVNESAELLLLVHSALAPYVTLAATHRRAAVNRLKLIVHRYSMASTNRDVATPGSPCLPPPAHALPSPLALVRADTATAPLQELSVNSDNILALAHRIRLVNTISFTMLCPVDSYARNQLALALKRSQQAASADAGEETTTPLQHSL